METFRVSTCERDGSRGCVAYQRKEKEYLHGASRNHGKDVPDSETLQGTIRASMLMYPSCMDATSQQYGWRELDEVPAISARYERNLELPRSPATASRSARWRSKETLSAVGGARRKCEWQETSGPNVFAGGCLPEERLVLWLEQGREALAAPNLILNQNLSLRHLRPNSLLGGICFG